MIDLNRGVSLENKITIEKLEISEGDVMIVKVPRAYIDTPQQKKNFDRWLKDIQKLLPYKNKIIALEKNMDIKIVHKSIAEEWLGIDFDIK